MNSDPIPLEFDGESIREPEPVSITRLMTEDEKDEWRAAMDLVCNYETVHMVDRGYRLFCAKRGLRPETLRDEIIMAARAGAAEREAL